MKALLLPIMWIGLALVSVATYAQTAHPRIIAGFDHIAMRQVREVLVAFCKGNECKANVHTWQLIVGNTTPVSIGGECRLMGRTYEYCVDVWGEADDKAYMNPMRTKQLKAMLESKGAKVTLMDCSFEWGSGHGDYVCANGKPLPSQ